MSSLTPKTLVTPTKVLPLGSFERPRNTFLSVSAWHFAAKDAALGVMERILSIRPSLSATLSGSGVGQGIVRGLAISRSPYFLKNSKSPQHSYADNVAIMRKST
ncbi:MULTISPECIES: hypothetical protein [Roseomonas]|uniref:hypothetical protein n=1 Tax=Roseomonas TaxID=125216 RepID=UPI001865FAF9|nr:MULTISPECIES: hypothetical protein [Roseomonas]MDT8291465.1 hypothetical protein [Roseomonas mucosa]HWL81659.1 hypothetical protein [Roseomonas sp.]